MSNLLLRRRMLMQAGGSPTPPTPSMVYVDYLECNGGAYIDTGITPNSLYKIECVFAFNGTFESLKNSFFVFGAGSAYNSNNIELYSYNQSRAFEIHYSAYQNRGSWIDNDTQMYRFIQNKGACQLCTQNGLSQFTYSWSDKSFTCPYSMTLFATHRSSIITSDKPVRIRNFKMWDENDNLVCDYAAVRYDGVGYMYDSVSGQLIGNVGTGSFNVGEDIIMVDYLESTGTQYMRTYYTNTATDDYEIEIAVTNTSGDRKFWGDSAKIGLAQYNNKWRVVANWVFTSKSMDTDWHKIWTENNTTYIDGDILVNTNKVAGNHCLYVFLINNGNNVGAGDGCEKIKHLKIYDGNVIKLDLYPCRIGTIGYLLDLPTRMLYANAGTGDFILGADK